MPKIKHKWVIARYPHGVVLNPMEYVLGEEDEVKLFDSAGQALDFWLDNGGSVDDINNGIYIQQELSEVEP